MTDDPIDLQSVMDSVTRPTDGAIAFFAGVVRNHNDGKQVESIFYDAYRDMAEKELAGIVSEVAAKYPEARIALTHRLGLLRVGDCSIAIACSSPHRAEAFAACREVIELVKQRVPIWKKEKSPTGESWVGWQH